MADTPFNGFTLVTSLADTDIFLALRGAGGINFTGETLAAFASRNAAQGSAVAPGHTFYGDADTGMYRAAANTLGFSTQGVERARLDPNGNLAIGTPSALGRLDIANAARVRWDLSTAIAQEIVSNPAANAYAIKATDANSHRFLCGGTERVYITGTGLGIGSSSLPPVAPIDLTTGAGRMLFTNEGSANALHSVNSVNNAYLNQVINGIQMFLRTGNIDRLVIDGSGHVKPGADNTYNMGLASARWAQIYAAISPINTSDERAKQDIEPVPNEWLDAWGEVQWVRYKMRDSVAAKGEAARWHVGLIAQRVRDVFAERGLDARAIGLLCYDEWSEDREPIYEERLVGTETVVVDRVGTGVFGSDGAEIMRDIAEDRPITGMVDTGETRVTLEAGDRWGLRYDECQAMEAAWQRRELARKDAVIADLANRLAALEAA